MQEDQLLADEEMRAFVHRAGKRQAAHGLRQDELDVTKVFPEPINPLQPLSNKDVIVHYGRDLSSHEVREILDYPEVYWWGAGSPKIQARTENSTNNHGYDDDRGDYQFIAGDHLLYRYEIMSVLGKGSFGQVLQCRDHKTGLCVAIKLIRNKKRFHAQAQVEIHILAALKAWVGTHLHEFSFSQCLTRIPRGKVISSG